MKQEKIKKRKGLTLAVKQEISGYLFISPFILGFFLLFAVPMFQSLLYSVSNLKVTSGGFYLESVKWANYQKALLVDPEFTRTLVEAAVTMCMDVPIILIFSFFAATLINQKFRGRGIVRVIFFLPVILVSGVIVGLEKNNAMLRMIQEASNQEGIAFISSGMTELLMQLKLSPKFVQYILNAVDHIYNVVISSGVQILIFLAGLQSISSSIYESASIEGATAWESFWKITLPMISSLILVNTVYTIVDSFTRSDNKVIMQIREIISIKVDYGLGSAMAWIYFIVIGIITAIIIGLISRKVFYYD